MASSLSRASLRYVNSTARNTTIWRSSSVVSRTYSSAAEVGDSSSSSSSSNNPNNQYVSPFQDIFDTIQEGKTFLGTSEFAIPEIKMLKCGIPEHVLKFKTTAFDRLLEAPHVHNNEHRVTLQLDVKTNTKLDDVEMMVLKEIVGGRYQEEKGILQLSSNQFGSRIENKRHCVSMLERIMEQTKTLAARIQQEVIAASSSSS